MGSITFLEECAHWNREFFSVFGKKTEKIFHFMSGIQNKWPQLEPPSKVWSLEDG